MSNKSIIFITDLIDQRLRKEKEIEFYEKELTKIEEKLFFLRKEKQLTQFIIDIIEKEQVVDIREQMYERLEASQRESILKIVGKDGSPIMREMKKPPIKYVPHKDYGLRRNRMDRRNINDEMLCM